MAVRAPRPCRVPGCSALSRDGSGYCEDHKHLKSNWRQTSKGSSTERGYGYKWQKLRARVLKRDKHLCQLCLQMGIVRVGNEVDHIKRKADGGTDDMDNLMLCCSDCHKAKTARENRKS